MPGEHILKLLIEGNARVDCNNRRWLVVDLTAREKIYKYTVYEHKLYAKKVITLVETEDEEEACKILKGE